MTKKQRKNLVITSPLLFSLCCFSAPFLEALSFKDLIQTNHPISIEEDMKSCNSNFNGEIENISLTLPNSILPFLVFSESQSTIEGKFLYSNSPISFSFLKDAFFHKQKIVTSYKDSYLSQFFLKKLPTSAFSTETEALLCSYVLHQTEEYSLLSDLLYLPSLYKDLSFKEESIDILSMIFKNYPNTLIQDSPLLSNIHIDSSDNLPLLHRHITKLSPKINPHNVSIEKSHSVNSPCIAAKESSEYSLNITVNDVPLKSKDDSEKTLSSFVYHPLETNSDWNYIHSLVSPSLLSLPYTTHLQIIPIARVDRKSFNQDVKFSKQGLRPSLEPYLELTLKTYKFIPDISENVNTSSVAFKSSYSLDNLALNYTNQIPFQCDKAFLASTFSMNNFLISYIFNHAPTPHIANTSSPTLEIKKFIAQKQDSTFNYSFSISSILCKQAYNSIDSLDLSSGASIAFKELTSTKTYPLYAPKELFVKESLFFLSENRDINPTLMNDLTAISPTKNILTIEVVTVNPLFPNKESLYTLEMHSHPFLQNFYDQITTEIHPFMFSVKPSNASLKESSFITYEKNTFDNSYSLLNLSTLLETTGDKQSFDYSCQNNPTPLSLNPNQEAEMLSKPSANNNPNSFMVFYDMTKDTTAFLPITANSFASYIHNIPISITKQPLSSHYCNLFFDYTLLNDNFTFSPSLHQDILGDLNHLIPNYETPNLLAYQQIFKPHIQQKTLSIEKTNFTTTKTPKLFSQVNPIPSLVASKADLLPSRKKAATLNKSSRNIQENLYKLPTLQELQTLSLSEEFTIDLKVAPNPKEKGYLFSINLEPVTNKLTSGSAQNFVFLVDRSSSIDKNRFQVFKQAISKSLLYLKEEDTFNILTFDTEIAKMSHTSVYVSSSTKHGAKRFLETQRRGYKFVLPNLYNILLNVHEMTKDSPLPTTVILLTNGKTLENFNPQDHHLSHFVSKNQNGFTLFTACASQNNNTLMLEVLSHLNRGEFMHSQTNAAFPRKLASFVKHAGYLLAKDIHISAAKTNPDINIEFFPDVALAPNLYGDRSYTIVGKIDNLCDFDLVLQGRFCENWLNITKRVSFKTAKNGGHSIYKDYTMHAAYNNYRTFLKGGNTAYLDEAKKILLPFNTSTAY